MSMNLKEFLKGTPFINDKEQISTWKFSSLMDTYPATKDFFINGSNSYAEKISDYLPKFSSMLRGAPLVAYLDVTGERVGICTELNGVTVTFNPIWPRSLKSRRRKNLPPEIVDSFYSFFEGAGIAQTAYCPSSILMPLDLSGGWRSLDTLLIEASQKEKIKKADLKKVFDGMGIDTEATMAFLSTRHPKFVGVFEHILVDTSRQENNIYSWVCLGKEDIFPVNNIVEKLDIYLHDVITSGGNPPNRVIFA